MTRLKTAITKLALEGESFTWLYRNWPIFKRCSEKSSDELFCISHKLMINSHDYHLDDPSTHLIVVFCKFHGRMEESSDNNG